MEFKSSWELLQLLESLPKEEQIEIINYIDQLQREIESLYLRIQVFIHGINRATNFTMGDYGEDDNNEQ